MHINIDVRQRFFAALFYSPTKPRWQGKATDPNNGNSKNGTTDRRQQRTLSLLQKYNIRLPKTVGTRPKRLLKSANCVVVPSIVGVIAHPADRF